MLSQESLRHGLCKIVYTAYPYFVIHDEKYNYFCLGMYVSDSGLWITLEDELPNKDKQSIIDKCNKLQKKGQ